MQYHKAQYLKHATVVDLPGLFRKNVVWNGNEKKIYQITESRVVLHKFNTDEGVVHCFVSEKFCFCGLPQEDGFKPYNKLTPPQKEILGNIQLTLINNSSKSKEHHMCNEHFYDNFSKASAIKLTYYGKCEGCGTSLKVEDHGNGNFSVEPHTCYRDEKLEKLRKTNQKLNEQLHKEENENYTEIQNYKDKVKELKENLRNAEETIERYKERFKKMRKAIKHIKENSSLISTLLNN